MKHYYLAYGSNLNLNDMKYRCPNAKKVGTAILKDYHLLFKGLSNYYLTIEKQVGEEVPLGVFEVNEDDIKALDYYEGYPSLYYKKEIKVNLKDDNNQIKEINAFIYIMYENYHLGLPSDSYLKTVKEGYNDFDFDINYINKALIASGGK